MAENTKELGDLVDKLSKAMQAFASNDASALKENLDASSEAAEKMAKRARETVEFTDLFSSKMGDHLMRAVQDTAGSMEGIKKLGGEILDDLDSKLGKVAKSPMMILVTLAIMATKRFGELEQAAADFRKQVGLSGDQTVELERIAGRVNTQYQNMGVSLSEVYSSIGAIVEEFGRTDVVSEQIVKNISQFSAALGISDKTSVGFTKNMSMISGMSLDVASNFEATAYNMAKTSGVAPVKVIEDMANASDDTLIAFSGMPDKLLSASIYARQLGTNINELSKSTRGLLDFQSSISAEMEASTLLGQTFNLHRARQLRFAGDIAGANEEILKRVESIGDFNSLNVFQQEAIAKATGKSVGDLQKQMMLRKQGFDISQLDAKAQEQALANAQNMTGEQLDQLVRESDIRSEQAKMMGEINSLMLNLSEILVPIVRLFVNVFTPILQILAATVKSIIRPFQEIFTEIEGITGGLGVSSDLMESIHKGAKSIGDAIGTVLAFSLRFYVQLLPIWSLIFKVSKSIYNWSKPLQKVVGLIKKVPQTLRGSFEPIEKIANVLFKFIGKFLPFGSKLGGIFGSVVRIMGSFAKAVPVIGWVIFGVEALVRFVKELFTIWRSTDTIGEKIANSFKALPMAIIKTFLAPFKMIFNWVGKMFGIQNLGSLILDPITNVFGMMYDVMLSPFKKIWAWLADTFFGKSPSKLGLNILKGIQSVSGMISDVLLAPFKMVKDFTAGIFESIFGDGKSESDKFVESINNVSSGNMLTMDNVSEQKSAEKNADGKESDNKMISTKNADGKESDNRMIVEKLDELISMMKNGGISVNLDGRKVSQQLAQKVY